MKAENCVGDAEVHALYTPAYLPGSHWPVYLWLDHSDGTAWVEQFEPGAMPIEVANGEMSMWQIGDVPTIGEARDLVNRLLPELTTYLVEIEEEDADDSEIADICQSFVSGHSFSTVVEILESPAETAFCEAGDEVDIGDPDARRIEYSFSPVILTAESTDASLTALAADMAKHFSPTILVDVESYVNRMRRDLKDNAGIRQGRAA